MARRRLTTPALVAALCVPETSVATATEAWFTTDTPVDVTGSYTQATNLLITEIPSTGLYGAWFQPNPLHAGGAITSLHALPEYVFLFTMDAPFEMTVGGAGFDSRTIMRYQDFNFLTELQPPGLPPGTVIDGLALLPGGDYALSFDAPVRIGAVTYLPADAVRFTPPGTYAVLWSGTAHGFGPADNVDAVHVVTPTDVFLSFDGRAVLEGVTLEPHEVARWTPGSAVKVLSDPAGFSPGENVAGFTIVPPPGTVPDGTASRPGTPLTISKAGAQLHLEWGAPCAGSGVDGFGIYEGPLASPFVYGHGRVDCPTTSSTSRDVTPTAGSRYYIVVPLGYQEGSYGRDSSLLERPPGSPRCRPLGPDPSCNP